MLTYKARCGDVRKLIRNVPTGSVDCIVTDPAYRVISGGKGKPGDGSPTGVIGANDGKIFKHNDIRFSEYIHDMYRVLRDPGHAYFMVNVLNLESLLAECRRVGFKLHNVLDARKQNATPSPCYMKNNEYVVFVRKGRAFRINNCGSKTSHDWENPVGNKSHPTEKSVDLMKLYVENSTQPGQVVLDPFMGSGATGVACRETGRSFIGMEIEQKYYATACRRIGVMPCL